MHEAIFFRNNHLDGKKSLMIPNGVNRSGKRKIYSQYDGQKKKDKQ